jgi:hypothetical protein
MPMTIIGEPVLKSVSGNSSLIELSFDYHVNTARIDKLNEILKDYKVRRNDGRPEQDDVCFGRETCFRNLHPNIIEMLSRHCRLIEYASGAISYSVSLIRTDGTEFIIQPVQGGEFTVTPSNYGVRCDRSNGYVNFGYHVDKYKSQWTNSFWVPTAELANLKKFSVSRIAAFDDK